MKSAMDVRTFRLWLIALAVLFCIAVGGMCVARARQDAGPRTNLEMPEQRGM